MKYIRTKDGIYKVVDTYETKYVIGYTEDGFEISIYKENVISQAETIDELCDELVIEYRDGSKIISIHDNTKEFLKEHKYELKSSYIKNVYGAIWADKGLIYVAKMDSDGKLELI